MQQLATVCTAGPGPRLESSLGGGCAGIHVLSCAGERLAEHFARRRIEHFEELASRACGRPPVNEVLERLLSKSREMFERPIAVALRHGLRRRSFEGCRLSHSVEP